MSKRIADILKEIAELNAKIRSYKVTEIRKEVVRLKMVDAQLIKNTGFDIVLQKLDAELHKGMPVHKVVDDLIEELEIILDL